MATSLLPVIGKPAPDFTLPSTTGENVSLKQFKGKKTVVLYFYPKDETPGCTAEACDFRDHSAEFEKHDTVILGVSTDPLESHQQFREKHQAAVPAARPTRTPRSRSCTACTSRRTSTARSTWASSARRS